MISWIGGKYRQSKWINEFIPKDTKKYVEVFGGAFWNYLKSENLTGENQTIIYNDFNPLVVNMFHCTKQPDKLLKKLEENEVYNEEIFNKHRDVVVEYYNKPINFPDFDLATAFIYVMTHIFSGSAISKSSVMCYPIKIKDARAGKKFNRNTGKYNAVKKRLKSLKNKLENIDKIYNEDFEVILQKEDSKDTLFYLDPPYFGKENFYANHNFGIKDHKRMADALKKIKGRFIVSYYYYPELEEWFPKDKYHWEQKDYTVCSGAVKGKTPRQDTEILIMNY